ncbi:hypothetical protein FRB96_002308 [Tulasnella sp. 330]|nr:hypothetical protein FRB96_002308 [Tulasnella sp. 330]KAG8881197.1 hypothetical protein FRB98_004509 [Tulasnella sp. 332]
MGLDKQINPARNAGSHQGFCLKVSLPLTDSCRGIFADYDDTQLADILELSPWGSHLACEYHHRRAYDSLTITADDKT